MKTVILASLLLGTSALAQTTPQAREAAFDKSISAPEQMGWLKSLSSAPNHVGAAHNKANALWMLDQYKSWGWDARIEEFEVLYPTPLSTTLELLGPVTVKLGGQEPAIPQDATSANLKDALPPYVAFQGDGDVTGDVVYVNYGLPADYEALARRGISVKGKIALARYGGGWRGLKPKLAQEQGAIGSLIYSDPANDGYATADVYPDGGARPDTGVQRGSVADMTTYPGDPGTPGYGSVKGAKRIDRKDSVTVMKIPTLPISYRDATQILRAMGGPIAPENFRGALPFSYHTGGDGKIKLRLAVQSEWSLKPVYNVIAVMKGKDRPDEWVVRGNHHDGWVFGAADPLSGNVAMLSEAKALGQLAKSGWRPSRTIVYASWDAEEPMLLGSTEWAETHEAELKAKAIIYINTDGNGRGFLSAEGSHQYQHLVNQVAADVTDPQTGASVADRLRAKRRADAFDGARVDADDLKAAESGGDMPIGALGSGSDYSAFLQHVGVPSLNIGFGGEGESDGSYHSIYDSYDHFVRFDDPGLAYGAALSKVVGRVVMRVADAPTPPVRFGDLAATVRTYLSEVRELIDTRRKQDDKRAGLLSGNAFALASDPRAPVAAPPAKASTPVIELAALENAVARLETAAKAFDAALAAKGAGLDTGRRARLNAALLGIDQALLIPEGLPGRGWYKHALYAPGRFTGYGAKTLPGVREAVEERRFADANAYAGHTAAAITRLAERLDVATAIVG
ncbi:transferrin receptor-like dimerization domain-containing protein [Sandarakinorhabdus sp.]|uniref:transferrin receptor-like dimerization domain-containing protein n=1 Tax=Sandarakinorhabdus sp. TaxID=1916663 RepID=UPI00286EA883|nr:transferrin receptor-like dimerization domain-containing protein [Sandarakinorhabdus sp.]